MEISLHHQNLPADSEAYNKVLSRTIVENLTNSIKDAFICKYHLTKKQHDLFSRIMSPIVVDYAKIKSSHNHPIPAMLQQIAYNECHKFSKNFKRSIDVGGTPLRTPDGHHLCTLINDCRTHSRYVNACVLNQSLDFSHGLFNKTRRICTYGAENCTYQAPYAYAINVYDIPIETVPLIMSAHNIQIFDFWMFFPNVLIDKRLHDDEDIYETELFVEKNHGHTEKNINISFSFGDGSTSYVHNYVNWRKYLTTTRIDTPSGSIFVEFIGRSYHTFRCLRFTKTNFSSIVYERHMKPYGGHDYYEVPNVLRYFFQGKAVVDMWLFASLVETRIVDDAFAYINRQADAALNYSNFCSFLDSKSAALYYQTNGEQKLIMKKLDLNAIDYIELAISLYVIGMINRIARTRNIGLMIGSLKSNGLWHEIKRVIKKFFIDIEDQLLISARLYTDRREIYEQKAKDIDYTKIENLTIRPYKVDKYKEVVKVGLSKEYGYNVSNKFDSNNAYSLDKFNVEHDFTADDHNVERGDTPELSNMARTDEEDANTQYVETSRNRKSQITGTNNVGVIKQIVAGEEDQPNDIKRSGLDAEDMAVSLGPPNEHYRVLFNPSGAGGRCGLYCINHFLKVNPMTTYPNAKTSMLISEDFASIAYQCKFNVIVHTKLSTEIYYTGGATTLRVANTGAHWVVVDCPCVAYNHYVGEYKSLTLNKNYLYVNCANQQFGDGAGQALAFRSMFDGYQNHIPDRDSPSQHMVYNGYHLFLAVANQQNINNDRKLTFIRYARIFTDMERYALENDLCIYLPLIGTLRYGCDLCCFKWFVLRLKCKYTLCFYNDNEKQLYDRTRDCQHCNTAFNSIGGALDYGIFSDVSNKLSKYDDTYYQQLMPAFHRSKMCNKFDDILAMIADDETIIEISCAPGGFFKHACDNNIDYMGFHYCGKGAMPFMHKIKPTGEWHNIKMLNELLTAHMVEGRKYHLLLDSPTFLSLETHNFLLDFAAEKGLRYTTKFMTYSDSEFDSNTSLDGVSDSRFDMRLWHNVASNELSSELFVTYTKTDNKPKPVADVHKIMQSIDKFNLDNQDAASCNCDHNNIIESNVNAKITWEHSEAAYHALCDDLSKDKLNKDINFTGIKEHKPVTSIDAIIGVAGSSKSRGILKGTCSVCTIVIAPFRVVSKQHSVINSTSVTYVKAIAHAKRTKKTKLIVIDEFYAMSPYMATIYSKMFGCRMIALGDPCQIRNIDLGKVDPEVKTEAFGYRNFSYRITNPICELLSTYIPGIKSSKPGNVYQIATMVKPDVSSKGIILTHTQKRKAEWMKKFDTKNVRTVAEAMGSTFNCVYIDVTDITDIIRNKGRHVYTGLTRSSGDVTLVGSSEQIANYIKYLSDPSTDYPIVKKIKTINPKKEEVIERTPLDIPKAVNRTEAAFSTVATRATLTRDVERTKEIAVDDNAIGIKPLVKVESKDNSDIKETISVLGSRVEDAMTAFDVVPHSDNVHQTDTKLDVQVEPLRSLAREQFDLSAVQEILDKVYIPANDLMADNVIGYKDNLIKEIKSDKNINLPLDAVAAKDEELVGVRMSKNTTYNRSYLGKDNKMLVDTIVHRYMNKANELPKDAADIYYKGLCKFMNNDFIKCRKQDAEDCWASVRCYLENLQKKMGQDLLKKVRIQRKLAEEWRKYSKSKDNVVSINSDDAEVLPDVDGTVDDPEVAFSDNVLSNSNNRDFMKRMVGDVYLAMKNADSNFLAHTYNDFEAFVMQMVTSSDIISDQALNTFQQLNEDWYSNKSKVIDFHCKNQPKEVRGVSFDIKDKVGQGISAWSKILNVIMATFCKGFESDFKNHLSDKVLLAIDASDRDISAEFAKRGHLYTDNRYRRLDCDISEFDSSQNSKTVAMHCLILRHQGFNQKAINFMAEMRANYRCNALINSKEIQRIKFDVSWVMTSGALFTLSGNTIVNIAIIGASFDIKDMQFAAFKGDDSHVVASVIGSIKHGNMLTSAYLGHRLKPEMQFFSEFIANFITPTGFFPDVLRRVSRVVSKVYTKPDDWDKIKLSIADSLMVITNDQQLNIGCQFASCYYKERNLDISPDEVYTLLSFLKRVTYDETLRPTEMTKYKIRQINLNFD